MNLSSSDLSGGGRGSPSTIFLSGLIFIFTERVFSIKDPVSLKNFEQLPSAATRGQQTAQSLVLFQLRGRSLQVVCTIVVLSIDSQFVTILKLVWRDQLKNTDVPLPSLHCKKNESDEVRWSQSWSKVVKFRQKPMWIYQVSTAHSKKKKKKKFENKQVSRTKMCFFRE